MRIAFVMVSRLMGREKRQNSLIQSLGTSSLLQIIPGRLERFQHAASQHSQAAQQSPEQEAMHTHQYRLHPDWIARGEMFRQFASRTPEPEGEDAHRDTPAPLPAARRWPLPKLSYRHRSTFSPRPR